MLINKLPVILILMLSLGMTFAQAEIVEATKTAILTADTNTDDPIKLKQALAQILAKNTGESLESILQNPVFKQANVKDGIKRSYFERIDSQYASVDSPYRYWFHIVVQDNYIKSLIEEAGFSLLPINRSKIILWMVEEGGVSNGNNSNDKKISFQKLHYIKDDALLNYWIERWAQALGIVVVYPELDSTDRTVVKRKSIKTLSYEAVDQSGSRYGIQDVLMIYIKKETKSLRIRSGYVSHEEDIVINHFQEPRLDLGSAMYSLMADTAKNYFQKNKIDANNLLKHNVRMIVNDINSYNQLTNVQNYLSDLSVIDAIEIQSASNGQLVLSVDLLIKTPVFLQMVEHDAILSYQQDSRFNQLRFRAMPE